MKKKLLLLALIIFALIPLMKAANWTQVTNFIGSGTEVGSTTDYFNVPHTEWRIVWNYTPDPAYPTMTRFGFTVYPQGETVYYTATIFQTGNTTTSGVSYVHGTNGVFYGKFDIANIQTFNISVEEDTTSPIPEFTTGFVLIMLAAATLFAVILAKRTRKIRVL